MADLALVPLFMGPVELMLVGAVILVLIFGSRATDIAREAGSAAGKVRSTRAKAESEIEDVRSELDPVKEEVETVEEDLESVEEELDAAGDDLSLTDSAEDSEDT